MNARFAAATALVLVLLVACGGPDDPATTAPAPPSDVTATPGPGYVTVTWQDESTDEEAFVIYREPATNAALTSQQAVEVGRVGPDVTEFHDETVDVGVPSRYSVGAVGEDGAMSAATAAAGPTVIEPGVDVAVGTHNLGSLIPTPQTAIAFYVFVPPSEIPGENVAFEVTGPAGWNGGGVYAPTLTPDHLADGGAWALHYTPFVPGTYELSVELGATTYTASTTVSDAPLLTVAADVQVTESSTDAVSATWDPVPGAGSYRVSVFDAPVRLDVQNFGSRIVSGTSVTLDGLDLPDGDYFVGVTSLPLDETEGAFRPEVDRYDTSFAVSDTFTAALVDIAGTWSTTLEATESDCEGIPVGTLVPGDVVFEVEGDAVTATSESGAVTTGTRDGNVVTLTRSDETEEGEAYEVVSVSRWSEDAFTGESVYSFEGGCVVTWDFTGTRGAI